MTNENYKIHYYSDNKGKNRFPWLQIIIILALPIAAGIFFSSCSSVKKTQHTATEKVKIETVKEKDSIATAVKETTTKANESEEASKTITIEFDTSKILERAGYSEENNRNYLPLDAADYIGPVDSIDYDMARLYISGKTRLITNNRYKVRIKPNGEIKLSETPKSITIKENTSKQKSDSSSTKETATVQTKEKEAGTVTIEKKETQKNKSKWSFNFWWLLALIPVAYLLNRKFRWL